MSDLKIDFVNNAYSRGRISGLTHQPTPEDLVVGVRRLENMAEEWESLNICTGYAFEVNPDLNTPHNVPRKYWNAYESNLAVWLLSDFGKEPNPTLAAEQRKTLSQISARTAVQKETPYPSRHPIGKGNSRRIGRIGRFYSQEQIAPISCETVRMAVGDINDFSPSFAAYLVNSEDIARYTIEASDNLTIVSHSLASPVINYRIEATGASGLQQVKIVMTTTAGRIDTRVFFFSITDIDLGTDGILMSEYYASYTDSANYTDLENYI